MASRTSLLQRLRDQTASGTWLRELLESLAIIVLVLTVWVFVMIWVIDLARSVPPRAERVMHLSVGPVLPVLGLLPAYALPNDEGERFGTQQLRGQLYLLQFASGLEVDTGASYERLAELQGRLAQAGNALRVVIVESAPAGPVGLERAALRPLPRDWQRLWGGAELEVVARALHSEEPPGSSALLLVDQRGGVRGFYDFSRDAQGPEQLAEDLRCLRTCGPLSSAE